MERLRGAGVRCWIPMHHIHSSSLCHILCLRGCTFSKSVCEPWVCVRCGAKKPFFQRLCAGASLSALSHGHKDNSDDPFIFLTSCRLQEER